MASPDSYRIRPAGNRDAHAIRALVATVLADYGMTLDPAGTDADLQDIEASYLRGGGIFEVVEDEQGAIVGTCGLVRLDATSGELRKMYLLPRARGVGLGKRLLARTIAHARAIGLAHVELETASVLREAIRLYTKAGFRPLERAHLAGRCDRAFVLDLLSA